MVGSSRTWNTDEPGLGRPKALPSSAPRRTSVIWMVLSGRHMPVNVHLHTQRLQVSHPVTWTHATTTNPLLSSSATYIHLCPPRPPPPPSVSNPCLFVPILFLLCSHSDLFRCPDVCAAGCVLRLQGFACLLMWLCQALSCIKK